MLEALKGSLRVAARSGNSFQTRQFCCLVHAHGREPLKKALASVVLKGVSGGLGVEKSPGMAVTAFKNN